MGDRANVLVKGDYEKDNGVWLYSHWAGYELPGILQTALAKRERWGDGQYLARIIFCEMVKGDTGTTGYGVSGYVGDGNDRVLHVNDDKKTVSFKTKTWTFEEYVNLTPEEIQQVWE